jgi:hypothetical protein
MRSARKFAVLALLVVSAILTSTASAQMNGFGTNTFGGSTLHGVPPSVTSFGFGGTPGFHGVPPSVTSIGFGDAPFHVSRFGGFRSGPPRFRHQRRRRDVFFTPIYGGYYVPYDDYSGYNVAEPGVDDSMEDDYRGGPTIFDRRGPGIPRPEPRASEDYRADLNSNQAQIQPVPPEPVTDQPSTVLVFKDGHEQEVKNYAIIGATLYELSDGRTLKVELAQLDLPATVKHNDDRGVAFQLPAGTKSN